MELFRYYFIYNLDDDDDLDRIYLGCMDMGMYCSMGSNIDKGKILYRLELAIASQSPPT